MARSLTGQVALVTGAAKGIGAGTSVVAEVEDLFAEAVATFGPLDILVKNASVFAFASLEQTTDERGIRVNQINPGAVDTEGARAIGAMSDEVRAAHIARTPEPHE